MDQRLDAGRGQVRLQRVASGDRTGNRWYTWPGSRSRIVRTDRRQQLRR